MFLIRSYLQKLSKSFFQISTTYTIVPKSYVQPNLCALSVKLLKTFNCRKEKREFVVLNAISFSFSRLTQKRRLNCFVNSLFAMLLRLETPNFDSQKTK